MAKIVAVCRSFRKGERKVDIGSAKFIEKFGMDGDAHGGPWHRQVSLLAQESIDKMVEKGLDVGPGDFAENLTTKGIKLTSLPISSRLKAGEVILEVTQIGKKCHDRCAIYELAGDCVMPREGIFARVIKGGKISTGDDIKVVKE